MSKTRERGKEKRDVSVSRKMHKGRVGFEMKRTDEKSAIKQARKDAMLVEDNFSDEDYAEHFSPFMELSDLDLL